jgi:pimeloyl-ACP methyl ester carboxylesterase
MPVHLIGGTGSPLPARLVMRRLAARLSRVTVVTIVGLGHLAPITSPDRVKPHLPAWLQAGEPPSGSEPPAELLAA